MKQPIIISAAITLPGGEVFVGKNYTECGEHALKSQTHYNQEVIEQAKSQKKFMDRNGDIRDANQACALNGGSIDKKLRVCNCNFSEESIQKAKAFAQNINNNLMQK